MTQEKPIWHNFNVVVLAGGVGGAKLADGVARLVAPERLTIVVNTGDDFEHLGLKICPDLDTVMYTLAGVANPETGWGRAQESWRVMTEVAHLGGPDWFRLGDLDLATHLVRTHLLRQGERLTAVTRHLCQKFNISPAILPMSDQSAPTMIETDDAVLSFQDWFVAQRWQPSVRRVRLPEDVRASGAVARALELADLVLLAPSNPFVSIDPILNVYPVREMIMDIPRAVVAVTPIIGGQAIKGPAAKMMQELGMPVTATAVAAYYGDLIDGFVYDTRDEHTVTELPVAGLATDTWMKDVPDRIRLAQEVLDFAARLATE